MSTTWRDPLYAGGFVRLAAHAQIAGADDGEGHIQTFQKDRTVAVIGHALDLRRMARSAGDGRGAGGHEIAVRGFFHRMFEIGDF
ncbi:hypothetical protein ABFB10_06070 [Ponticoccus litoralis]|uniref:Uncharacterized protein n=1 Tax=Ponticoccus litoralis TaxID=422297 RepID=A0AAW9SL02_9RHOB